MNLYLPGFAESHVQELSAANQNLRHENHIRRLRLGWYRWQAAQQKQRQAKAAGAEGSPRPVQMALGF